MTARVVERPTWRSFRPEFLREASRHVRAGGFALVCYPSGRMRMLLSCRREGGLSEAAEWALLALGDYRWRRSRQGPTRGLAMVDVKRADRIILRDWCERDAACPTATRRMALDCLECGACCREHRLVIEPQDLVRWRRAGRSDLADRHLVRRQRGVLLMRTRESGACVHLEADRRCDIYPIRPDNCRVFPAGSECCLAAREETFGAID